MPELGVVYASATQTGEVVAIDEATMNVVARIQDGVCPDGVAYFPSMWKLYVSDETGNAQIVIETRTNKRVSDIPLESDADPVTQHVFSTCSRVRN